MSLPPFVSSARDDTGKEHYIVTTGGKRKRPDYALGACPSDEPESHEASVSDGISALADGVPKNKPRKKKPQRVKEVARARASVPVLNLSNSTDDDSEKNPEIIILDDDEKDKAKKKANRGPRTTEQVPKEPIPESIRMLQSRYRATITRNDAEQQDRPAHIDSFVPRVGGVDQLFRAMPGGPTRRAPASNPQAEEHRESHLLDKEPDPQHIPNRNKPDGDQSSQVSCTRPELNTPIPREKFGHSTGEQSLLVALSDLSTEKQTLEKALAETTLSLNSQTFLNENLEKKVFGLEKQVKSYKETTSSLRTVVERVRKFADGLGKDYDVLREKNVQLNAKLREVTTDRKELQRNLQDVKIMIEKVNETFQGWGHARAQLKGTAVEIEKSRCYP
jgi:hypothetical protein